MTRRNVDAALEGELLAAALADGTWAGAHLDGGQRLQVVDTLATVLAGAYTHLPAKRAAYATDPVQALALLRRRAVDLSDAEFHLAVTGVLGGLRDAHTRYLGPTAVRGHVAALPFLVEEYGPVHDLHYVVSKVNADVARAVPNGSTFVPGAEVLSWNGVPIARAVEVHADRESGGRPDSRRSRALESLTFRALDYGPPPDEHWVIVGYRTPRGAFKEARFDWRVLAPGSAAIAVSAGSRGALKVAADPAAEAVRRAKKLQFSPALWAADDEPPPRPPRRRAARAGSEAGTESEVEPAAPVEGGSGAGPGSGAEGAEREAGDARQEGAPSGTGGAVARPGTWIDTPLQDVVAAKALDDEVGLLRLWSFDVADDEAYLEEVARLLGLLPTGGLIVDLRSNPGGLVWAAERALQLFTDRRPIRPTRFSLVATPLTRQMAESPFNRLELEAWNPSLQDAVSTGEVYAQPLPLTDPAWCNDRERAYPGPAVAVVDANTYSSGDLFAAGWVDNEVGPLVAVGHATGGGGANVWSLGQLRDALTGTDSTISAMPAGAGMTVAIRRAIRSGRGDGIPIEDLGVPGVPYAMTRADLLEDNRDLQAFCRGLLAVSDGA